MHDTAIEFAQEILGWTEAYRAKSNNSGGIIHGKHRGASFRYNDLRQVLKLAKWWGKKNNIIIDFNCLHDDRPCVALMEACLYAKGKPPYE